MAKARYIADLTSREISPTGVQNLLDALETPGQENLRSIALVLAGSNDLAWIVRSRD